MPRFVGPGFLMPLAVAALLSMTTGQALANHVQCGDPIYQDTTLDSDLIDCPLTGIVIGADDVTLDLNGHTIDGAPGSGDGVYSGDHHGLRVRDGTIQEFRNGVRFETHGNPGPWREYGGGFRYPSSDALGGHIVRGLTVRDNSVSGIDVSGSVASLSCCNFAAAQVPDGCQSMRRSPPRGLFVHFLRISCGVGVAARAG
jgi:hypothetical protein